MSKDVIENWLSIVLSRSLSVDLATAKKPTSNTVKNNNEVEQNFARKTTNNENKRIQQ